MPSLHHITIPQGIDILINPEQSIAFYLCLMKPFFACIVVRWYVYVQNYSISSLWTHTSRANIQYSTLRSSSGVLPSTTKRQATVSPYCKCSRIKPIASQPQQAFFVGTLTYVTHLILSCGIRANNLTIQSLRHPSKAVHWYGQVCTNAYIYTHIYNTVASPLLIVLYQD